MRVTLVTGIKRKTVKDDLEKKNYDIKPDYPCSIIIRFRIWILRTGNSS